MNAVAFDTLEAVRGLEVTGVEHGQAEAMVRTMIAVNDAGRTDLATKADIAALKVEFAELKTEFAGLEAKFAAAVNKMLLSQIAVAGVLLAAMALLKFF